MRWEDFRQSANVEDRRGDGGDVGMAGMPFGGGGGLGVGAVIVLGIMEFGLVFASTSTRSSREISPGRRARSAFAATA